MCYVCLSEVRGNRAVGNGNEFSIKREENEQEFDGSEVPIRVVK